MLRLHVRSLQRRLLAKVDFPADENDPDACWLWTGAQSHGYGSIDNSGGSKQAHRVAYELVFGPIPDSMFACHRCNNRLCVRPSHIYPGTHEDNMRDAVAANAYSGERNGRAILTWEAVRAIRSELAAGATSKHLEVKYGTDQSTISRIKHNRVWKE